MYTKVIPGIFSLLFVSVCVLRSEDALGDTPKVAYAPGCHIQVSLDDFRALAFQKSPLIAEIDAEYAGALADAFEREVMRNPEVSLEQVYTHAKVGGADDPQSEVSLAQPLRLSNFGSRERVAGLIRKAGDQQRRIKLLELSQKLKLQFYTLHALQLTEQLLEGSEKIAVKKTKAIRDGVRKGLFLEGDEKLLEGEMYRLQAERRGVESSTAILQGELSREIGVPCLITTHVAESSREIPSEQELLEKARASELSENSRADLLEALSQEQARLEELDAYPELTPRLVYQHTNDGGDFFGAGVSLPLPFWDRNQGRKIRSKGAQVAAAAQQRSLLDGGLEYQIKVLRRGAVSAKDQANIFTTKVVPAYQTAQHAQERLYSVGKGSSMEMWQILRSTNEVQTQSVSLLLEAIKARVKLSLLVGEEI